MRTPTMNLRSILKINWFATTLVLVAVCFVVTTIGILVIDDDAGMTPPAVTEIERTLTDVKITGIASDTGLNYTIETPRALQYPEQEISNLDAPKIIQFFPERQTRTISADTGVYYETSGSLVLTGNVTIIESGDGVDESSVTTTDTLTIELGKSKN